MMQLIIFSLSICCQICSIRIGTWIFSSYDSLYPFLFQLAFEDGEHTFYRIGIWAVGWSKDVLKAKLVYPFDGCITVMYSQVVHDKADVIKEVSSS